MRKPRRSTAGGLARLERTFLRSPYGELHRGPVVKKRKRRRPMPSLSSDPSPSNQGHIPPKHEALRLPAPAGPSIPRPSTSAGVAERHPTAVVAMGPRPATSSPVPGIPGTSPVGLSTVRSRAPSANFGPPIPPSQPVPHRPRGGSKHSRRSGGGGGPPRVPPVPAPPAPASASALAAPASEAGQRADTDPVVTVRRDTESLAGPPVPRPGSSVSGCGSGSSVAATPGAAAATAHHSGAMRAVTASPHLPFASAVASPPPPRSVSAAGATGGATRVVFTGSAASGSHPHSHPHRPRSRARPRGPTAPGVRTRGPPPPQPSPPPPLPAAGEAGGSSGRGEGEPRGASVREGENTRQRQQQGRRRGDGSDADGEGKTEVEVENDKEGEIESEGECGFGTEESELLGLLPGPALPGLPQSRPQQQHSPYHSREQQRRQRRRKMQRQRQQPLSSPPHSPQRSPVAAAARPFAFRSPVVQRQQQHSGNSRGEGNGSQGGGSGGGLSSLGLSSLSGGSSILSTASTRSTRSYGSGGSGGGHSGVRRRQVSRVMRKELSRQTKALAALHTEFDTHNTATARLEAQMRSLELTLSELEAAVAQRSLSSNRPALQRMHALRSQVAARSAEHEGEVQYQLVLSRMVQRLQRKHLATVTATTAEQKAVQRRARALRNRQAALQQTRHELSLAEQRQRDATAELHHRRLLLARKLAKRAVIARDTEEVNAIQTSCVRRRQAIRASLLGDLTREREVALVKTAALVRSNALLVATRMAKEERSVNEYERAYLRLQASTGVDDISELVRRCLSQPETERNLQRMREHATAFTQKLSEEREWVADELHQIRLSGLGHLDKLRGAQDELEAQAVEKRRVQQRALARRDFVLATLNRVRQGVHHLVCQIQDLRQPTSSPVTAAPSPAVATPAPDASSPPMFPTAPASAAATPVSTAATSASASAATAAAASSAMRLLGKRRSVAASRAPSFLLPATAAGGSGSGGSSGSGGKPPASLWSSAVSGSARSRRLSTLASLVGQGHGKKGGAGSTLHVPTAPGGGSSGGSSSNSGGVTVNVSVPGGVGIAMAVDSLDPQLTATSAVRAALGGTPSGHAGGGNGGGGGGGGLSLHPLSGHVSVSSEVALGGVLEAGRGSVRDRHISFALQLVQATTLSALSTLPGQAQAQAQDLDLGKLVFSEITQIRQQQSADAAAASAAAASAAVASAAVAAASAASAASASSALLTAANVASLTVASDASDAAPPAEGGTIPPLPNPLAGTADRGGGGGDGGGDGDGGSGGDGDGSDLEGSSAASSSLSPSATTLLPRAPLSSSTDPAVLRARAAACAPGADVSTYFSHLERQRRAKATPQAAARRRHGGVAGSGGGNTALRRRRAAALLTTSDGEDSDLDSVLSDITFSSQSSESDSDTGFDRMRSAFKAEHKSTLSKQKRARQLARQSQAAQQQPGGGRTATGGTRQRRRRTTTTRQQQRRQQQQQQARSPASPPTNGRGGGRRRGSVVISAAPTTGGGSGGGSGGGGGGGGGGGFFSPTRTATASGGSSNGEGTPSAASPPRRRRRSSRLLQGVA